MEPGLTALLLILSLLLIVILCGIILRQLDQLKALSDKTATQERRTEEHLESAKQSISILARSILAEQMDYSEACIRIKVLLDTTSPHLQKQPPFDIFEQVFNQLADHPTHEARDSLSKQQRLTLDKERWTLEDKNRQAIRAAADALLKILG
jgi:hypothetical protein